MKEVVLSVTNNLETDQRVNKVAHTLIGMGYDVTVIGSNHRECHAYNPGYKTKRLSVWFKKGVLFYAEYNLRLFLFLLLHKRYDVYVANDTDTLLPNFFIHKVKNGKLVVDLHELFPELPEVTNRKFVKWVWTSIEDLILPHVVNGYTVCQSIADYYKNKYSITLKVVRNIPNYKEYTGKKNLFSSYTDKKVILYQGAVNEGRGIEWIMDAMPLVDNAIFIVIGTGTLYDSLKDKAKDPIYKDRVLFLGHKPYSELIDYTLSSDLGVCLLKNQGLSYYYALPNRIFDFMQAHVPMLATGFPEIARIINREKTGYTINTENPEEIAKAINFLLMQKFDDDNFARVAGIYNWENEQNVLKEIYSNI